MPAHSANILADFTSAEFWILQCIFGLSAIMVLLLCAKRKKQNSVTMIRYIKNDDVESPGQRSRAPTNGTGTFERESERRISQHSIPNENRILPEIPKNTGNGNTKETPPTPDQPGTPGDASLDGTQRNSSSSPKKSRRLPALPPTGNVDLVQAAEIAQREKDIDATYEDLRDDPVKTPDPQTETVGSGDSALYAKVPEDLKKQNEEEDSDLYAQVGAAGDSGQKVTVSVKKDTEESKAGSSSSSNEEDKTMDSPTAVTYASVDKMKKTMSMKRSNGLTASFGPPPPPVPDRLFDEEDGEAENPVEIPPPPRSPPVVQESLISSPPPSDDTPRHTHSTDETEERTGPAYDVVSVRESFAHQRLRQMVEDEKRNRYVNTSQATVNGHQPDVYSQIEDENSEAVYESVSAPGSADGTVGLTGRNSPNSSREDGYSTIQAARAAAPSAPPNGQIANPDYEDINPR